MAFLSGCAIGLFLALSSSFILKKTFQALGEKESKLNYGYAAALSSIWMAKILAACFAIAYAQKLEFSTLQLGLGIPPGILLGVFLYRKQV